jgi:hypothetical protein
MLFSYKRSFMTIRTLKVAILTVGFLALSGCGGQISDSFAHSIYVEITDAGTLNPSSISLPNGYRIVFLNDDDIPHTINWESPLTLTAVAPAGSRAWFDLPPLPSGSVMSYHLDNSGAHGSVTMYVVTP